MLREDYCGFLYFRCSYVLVMSMQAAQYDRVRKQETGHSAQPAKEPNNSYK